MSESKTGRDKAIKAAQEALLAAQAELMSIHLRFGDVLNAMENSAALRLISDALITIAKAQQ